MTRKIKVTISKEDKYDPKELIEEIKEDPKSAYRLCEAHGSEGLTLDAFSDFDSLTQENKNRMIEDYATSKSNMEAELSEKQTEKFELFLEFFEEVN